MTKTQKAFLFDLLETASPTGFEVEGQRKWAGYVRKFANSVENDAYGTAWATIKGTAKAPQKVMLEAHADEIGYMVKHVTSDGFLRIDRIGGSDAATARGRRIWIFGDAGPVTGIIGNTAIHLRDKSGDEKVPKISELYVDIGAASAEEVAAAGIRVGHPAVYKDGVEVLGNDRLVGRALDNRIGGYIIARVMENLSKGKKAPASSIIAVNAVQEEIGGFGAQMVTHRLMPDVAVCLDVTHATDTPGIPHEQHGKVTLGGGPTVTHGTGNHPAVVKRLMEVAEKEGIPLQHEASSRFTGTDTDSIYPVGEGVPSALVSLPLRYMHSVVETVHLGDVDHVINLLTAFSISVGAKDSFSVKL
ncbi:MAG: M20/M25/M40 family metallo-hydrolase [Verrucomicrobiales bacterium]